MQENENRLEKFLSALNTVEVIERLEKIVHAKTNGGRLKLGLLTCDKENLNLFVSWNQKMNPSEEPKLSEEIMLTLGYDFTLPGSEISVHYPTLFSKNETEIFDAIIDITKENLVSGKLSTFLSTHYPESFKLPHDQNALSAVRPKTTERKNSDEENLDRAQRVIALLKSDPKLWETFTQNSTLWEEDQKKVGELIKRESPAAGNYASVKK